MEVVITKVDTYRSHGFVNQDDDKVRVVLDMSIRDFRELKSMLWDNGVAVYGDEK